MNAILLGMAVVLLAMVAAGMVRVIRGPTPADRMLAVLMFGTTGVAILLLLAEVFDAAALRDVALVFAGLAAVTGTAFVRMAGDPAGRREE